MGWVQLVFVFLRAAVRSQAELATENLVLRQQLAVLEQGSKRPRLRNRDRIFWTWIARLWPDWRSVLVIVQPATVIRWHKEGFRLYGRWKSRSRKSGRPKIDAEIRKLIRHMSSENPTWGTPRIRSELRLLGYEASKATVDKYRVRHRKPPSQTWRTFLDNHVRDIVAVDSFTVPTAAFRILFCFIVLRHHRRMVVHFNVTAHPTAQWTAQQVIEAFPEDSAPRFLLRDRDSIYGEFFRQRVKHMGIEEVVIAPRSPWQNPYVERLNGSIRRECLAHVIILNAAHLRRILSSYFTYYHEARPHLSLECNAPVPRRVEHPSEGRVIAIPQVGGLHHRYRRAA
ncbi:MAG: integrase core domain-containing protein [Phycisphaerae bacterium]|nr:integrase core domain-containing protein [Phycisphaerae bacterium]